MSESRLPRISRILAGLALRFPWAVLTAAAIATVLSLGLVAARLEFCFSHMDLIADGDRYRKLEAQDRQEFEEVPDRVVRDARLERAWPRHDRHRGKDPGPARRDRYPLPHDLGIA